MQKKFNITSVCIPGKHYMVVTSEKIAAIETMVEQGDYFVINRPRQYGKTTTLYLLRQEQIIYNYMASKLETSSSNIGNSVTGSYLDETEKLDVKKILSKFQVFIKEQYSEKDRAFIERNGR